ncbi:MAG: nitroreductase family protein [Candidatus Falkowbacteria bacterium]|nr:nitroreductase family protein [Candidatus Falkowbacteria bacterium]
MKTLDEIILARRTIRDFTDDIPSEEQIKMILRAGLHAPFASLAAQGGDKYRQFIIVGGQGEVIKEIRVLVQEQTKKFLKIIPFLNLFLKYKISETFKQRVQSDLLGSAPWYIFVVEPKGFPPAQKQSIAHCLENMWLKATELDLGFRPISVFENMGSNQRLCDLFSLAKSRYVINCCAVGCPKEKMENSVRQNLDDISLWLR